VGDVSIHAISSMTTKHTQPSMSTDMEDLSYVTIPRCRMKPVLPIDMVLKHEP
jgi:hypothetical protein